MGKSYANRKSNGQKVLIVTRTNCDSSEHWIGHRHNIEWRQNIVSVLQQPFHRKTSNIRTVFIRTPTENVDNKFTHTKFLYLIFLAGKICSMQNASVHIPLVHACVCLQSRYWPHRWIDNMFLTCTTELTDNLHTWESGYSAFQFHHWYWYSISGENIFPIMKLFFLFSFCS